MPKNFLMGYDDYECLICYCIHNENNSVGHFDGPDIFFCKVCVEHIIEESRTYRVLCGIKKFKTDAFKCASLTHDIIVRQYGDPEKINSLSGYFITLCDDCFNKKKCYCKQCIRDGVFDDVDSNSSVNDINSNSSVNDIDSNSSVNDIDNNSSVNDINNNSSSNNVDSNSPSNNVDSNSLGDDNENRNADKKNDTDGDDNVNIIREGNREKI